MKDKTQESHLKEIFVIRRYITYLYRICYDISMDNEEDCRKYLKFMSILEYGLENLDINYQYKSLGSYVRDVKDGLKSAKMSCDLDGLDRRFKKELNSLEEYLEGIK